MLTKLFHQASFYPSIRWQRRQKQTTSSTPETSVSTIIHLCSASRRSESHVSLRSTARSELTLISQDSQARCPIFATAQRESKKVTSTPNPNYAERATSRPLRSRRITSFSTRRIPQRYIQLRCPCIHSLGCMRGRCGAREVTHWRIQDQQSHSH